MKISSKIFIKVLPLFIAVIIYSCDFFAPFEDDFIKLSTDEINFGLFENEKEFIITYADSFDVNWEIIQPEPWIEVFPMQGIVNIDAPDTITVKINRNFAGVKIGPYTGNLEINFQDNTSSKKITVKMEIKASANLSVKNLNFGSTDSLTTFHLANEGNFPLKWKLSPSKDWIIAQPDSGTLGIDSSKYVSKTSNVKSTYEKNDTIITIKLNKEKLTVGDNNGFLELKTNPGNNTEKVDTIRVTAFKAAVPVLSADPTSLNFGNEINSQNVTIENSGTGTLKWSATSSQTWITLTPDNDSISTGSQELNVDVLRLGLLPGDYSGEVNINSNGGSSNISVTMTVPKPTELSFSPSSISFTKLNTEASIEIQNPGDGELVWELSSNENWLQLSETNGTTTTETDIINVSANLNELEPGSYNASIQINSNFGNGTIPVQLNIEATPVLSFSPSTLSFGKDDSTKKIDIFNNGDGDLNWELSTDVNWIVLNNSSGVLEPNVNQEIEVSIIRNGLDVGIHSGKININSNGGSGTVQVSLQIEESSKISVNPKTINLGDTDSTSVVNIQNQGTGDLIWQLSSNETWISFEPPSGTTSSNQNSEIRIFINRRGLEPGNHSGEVNITSNGGSESIKINMSVKSPPILSVNPTKIIFSERDSMKTIEIRNTGESELEWNVSSNESWIKLSPNTGKTGAKERFEISITIDRTNLATGEYEGNILISSNGGEERIEVTLTVDKTPVLSVKPTKYNLGDSDTSDVFVIENKGNGILEWNLEADQSWIQLKQTSGTTRSNEESEIEFFIDRSNLLEGSYDGTIKITSNGGDETIEVSIRVTAKPRITVSDNKLDFGTDTHLLVLSISNAGTGTLEWEITEITESWLTVSPERGSVTSGSAAIQVQVNRNDLTIDKYSTRFKVTSNGGDKNITVNMEVAGQPSLSLSQNEIDFSSSLLNASFQVENAGTGELNWTSEIMYIDDADDISWLSMSPTSGSFTGSSQTINLSVSKEGLSNGQHNADIQIYSNGGNKTLHLYMSVSAPNIQVSTTLLDFGETATEKTFSISNSGSGELNWELSKDESWISASPISGTTTSETDEITVMVDRDIVSSNNKGRKFNKNNTNEFTGNISVSGNFETKNIQIKMKLPEPPQLSFSHSSIDFGISTETIILQITNSGGGTLEWGLTIDVQWIHIDAANGTAAAGETDEITLTGLRDLEVGVHNGQITVHWNDDQQEIIPVSIEILAVD